MKLLIVTQAVDTEDPILGFFVRWIEEFAKHAEHVEVIYLKEGKYTLPANVRVHSLGKEKSVSRVKYIFNFYTYIWRLRHEYDAVFVHMNPEYVVLGGILWRLLGKHVGLWYTHKNVDMKLRFAALLSHDIFTASKESFRLRSSKVRVMGHGIDVDFFSPDQGVLRGTAALSAGRLSKTKRHDLIIRAAEHFPNDVRIVGDGPEIQNLKTLAEDLVISSRVHFVGPKNQEGLREEYRSAGVFVHTSETGSLDKVVLEALACGLPVVTTSIALVDLPVMTVSPTPDAIAKGVLATRQTGTQVLVAYVREHHSLQHLIPAILDAMQAV
ncbi:MAG: glycosyltransferase [Minisyncoccota bacterium]